jgi:ribose 5-phosphate isomerase A
VSDSTYSGPLSLDEMKSNAARAALDFVEPGSVLGIGSGTTVWAFLDALAEAQMPIPAALAASDESARRLRAMGIDVLDIAETRPSLYVDGADQVDMDGRAIKGGGAAQTREKAIATVSDYWVCVVDATKIVRSIGDHLVPVDVVPTGVDQAIAGIERMGGTARVREGVFTDMGNPVVDAANLDFTDAVALEDALDAIPGVVGNGVFAHRRADVILVGRSGGGVGRIIPHHPAEL